MGRHRNVGSEITEAEIEALVAVAGPTPEALVSSVEEFDHEKCPDCRGLLRTAAHYEACPGTP